MKKISVLLLDDNSLFRSGVRSLLQNDAGMEVVGEAGSVNEGIEMARDMNPDVVLMDITMPDIKGARAIAAVLGAVPSANILVLTFSRDEDDLFEAVKAGARGYILKSEKPGDIVRLVKSVASGCAAVSENLTSKIVEEFKKLIRLKEERNEVLTPREKEITVLLAEGMSNRDIAMRLSLSERTVKNHIQHILKKLNLKSRVHAAVYAVEHGWINRTVPYLPKGTTSCSSVFFSKMIPTAD